MNTQNRISMLANEMNGLFSNYYCPVTPEMRQTEEHLLNSFPVLAPLENQSFFLFNLNEAVFISADSVYEKILFQPVIYAHQKLNPDKLIEITHPDDILFSLEIEISAFRFFQQLPEERAKEFVMNYPLRLMNKTGGFDYYIISFKVAVSDEKGKPWLFLMHSRLCPLILPKNEHPYRIISIEPFNLFKKSKILDTDEYIVLTNREKDVAGEANKGFTKDQIAENLYISKNTVKKHFNNINKKICLKSIHQSCLYISKMGIIPL